ncbi:MAG TPA: VWA domain-containing protein [Candidatus Nanoarchaeia archaeon]|nr:VWA domain-containing protein [Candidatus Nanoarchaeia archaeon]
MVQFLNPDLLLLILPILALLAILIRTDFVKNEDEFRDVFRRRRYRLGIFITRTLIFACLVIVLATPFEERLKDTPGDPKITVLIDNSTSMELFETGFTDQLVSDLKKEIPITVRYITSKERSDIGEGILANLERNKNLLLISDGNNNYGSTLGTVSLFASNLNSTISMIELEAKKSDASVYITGPGKVTAEINNTYMVHINKVNTEAIHITLKIDDQTVLDTETTQDLITLDQIFPQGYHKIEAQITAPNDHFNQNNVFYKVTHAVEKPKILYLTEKDDPLKIILNKLYDVTQATSPPNDLKPFYAVIINDMPAERFQQMDSLNDYLINGNGMLVIGGFNSYDKGNYKDSLLETYLPVRVGAAEKKKGEDIIIIAIDISKGGGLCREIVDRKTKTKTKVCDSIAPIDVIKAEAIEVLSQLEDTNKVGVVAFDVNAYDVGNGVDHLYNTRNMLVEKIRKIIAGGNTLVSVGLRGASKMLQNTAGTKNIVLITDGGTYPGDQQSSVDIGAELNRKGVKVITIGIGRSVQEDFLKDLASAGGGFYIPIRDKQRLKILFGEPTKKNQGETFGLFVIDSSHFITKDLDLNAVLSGFNQVIPKSSSNMLITTDSGEPALIEWHYGLGKVITLPVFAGDNLGELLNERNSKLISRTINYLIGDPERKKPYFVTIDDTRVNTLSDIFVKTDKIPVVKGLEFLKLDQNTYNAKFTPTQIGFQNMLETTFAVDPPREYQEIGMNKDLPLIVQSTNGQTFKSSDTKAIIEFVKSVSKKTVLEKETFIAPFLFATLILFLIEVMLRRLLEQKLT